MTGDKTPPGTPPNVRHMTPPRGLLSVADSPNPDTPPKAMAAVQVNQNMPAVDGLHLLKAISPETYRLVLVLVGVLSGLFALSTTVQAIWKSPEVVAQHDTQIKGLEGGVRSLEGTVKSLESKVKESEERLDRQLEKLDGKLDRLLYPSAPKP